MEIKRTDAAKSSRPQGVSSPAVKHPSRPRRARTPKDKFAGKAPQKEFGAYLFKKSKPEAADKVFNPYDLKGPDGKNWTVLTYFAGDCNLEESMTGDLVALEKAGGSRPEMNILMQLDRGDKSANSVKKYGGKMGAARYVVTASKGEDRISSKEVKALGQVNSADPKVLEDFLAWGMKEYPAENYLILLSGHGGGVLGMMTDDGKNVDPHIVSTPELNRVIASAEKQAGVDGSQVLLGLSSCQMGQVENAYELKDSVAMMLASPSVTHTDSWRLEEMFGKPGMENFSLEEMADYIYNLNNTDVAQPNPGNLNPYLKSSPKVATKRISTHALVDLTHADKLKKAVNNFEKAVKNSPVDKAKLKEIMEIKSRPEFFSNTWVVEYASNFAAAAREIAGDKEIQDPALQKAAKEILAVLDRLVVKSTHRNDLEFSRNSDGLGITTASNPAVYQKAEYQNLAFDKDTGWSEFMTSYAPGISREDMDKRLSGTKLKYYPLGVMAQIADICLEKSEVLNAQIGLVAEAIKLLDRGEIQPDLTERDKYGAAYYLMKDKISAFDYIDQLNQMPLSRHNRESIDSVVDNSIDRAIKNPEHARPIITTTLKGISALEEGIQGKTLAQAASRMLEVEKTYSQGLSKENKERVRRMLEETDSDKREKMQEKLQGSCPKAVSAYLSATAGAELITTLGYAARSDKIVNLRNYEARNAKKFLKAVAQMED